MIPLSKEREVFGLKQNLLTYILYPRKRQVYYSKPMTSQNVKFVIVHEQYQLLGDFL